MLKQPLILTLILTGPLSAQAPAAPPAPVPPPAKLAASQVTPYHHVFRMISVQGDTLGVLDDQVVRGNDAQGQPIIIRIQNITGLTGESLDSAIADATTLSPRHHSRHSPKRELRIDFDRTRVTGELIDDGHTRPVSQEVVEGVFDSNMLDVLIGALPLAPGYSGRVMVYIYEAGGAIPMDVSVRGSQDLKGTDTWVTGVTLGRTTVVYYIGKTDHEVKQVLTPGMKLVRAEP
jgi:hypothetical protein